MASLNPRLDWMARISLRRFGLAGLAAAGIFTATLGLALYDGLVLEPQLAEVQPQRQLVQATAPAPKLPTLDQTSVLPGWLQQTAEEAGLELDQAQYELESSGPHVIYRAVLPLSGPYPAMRRFLAQTLNRYPNAALENLQIRRDDSADDELQIRLVLAFHLEGKP